MKRDLLVLAVLATLGSAGGCGDNSKQCGPGTIERNGVCEPDGTTPPICTDGTILDEESNSCVIDPNACQDGTVLVGDQCVDPGHVTTDVEEGIEPNGLGLLGEDSTLQAGNVVLKPIGENLVVHGKITPFQDANGDGQVDADIDTYVVEVTAPTLLTISVDGLHGLAGGLFSTAVVSTTDPLANWARIGANLTGDTSRRQLFLPAAGVYAIAITDSRTIFTGATAQPSNDVELEYYATITAETVSATVLTVTAGEATSTGSLAPGEVKLFTVPMDLGLADVTLETPDDEITGSIVVANLSGGVNRIKAVADEDDPEPAVVSTIGFRTGDTTTLAADHVVNLASSGVPYNLKVRTGGATPLSRTGVDAPAPTDPDDPTVFFYDVATANEVTGFDITFVPSVVTQIVDERLDVFARMTGDQGAMDDYVGLFRHPTAGRYYWLTFDPLNGGDDIVATSTITAVAPTTITKGTPTGAITVDPTFGSNALTYDLGINTDAWQQFTASSSSGTGEIVVRYFDPATTFGRLGDLTTLSGSCSPDCDDTFPIFQTSHVESGNDTFGRILLDDGTPTYFITVDTETASDFNLTFARRVHTDIGTKANVNDTDTRTNQPLDGTTTIQRYLVRSTRDHRVEVLAHPDGVNLDVRIQQLDNDESNRGAPVDAGTAGNDETGTLFQRGDGWTAWTVTSPITLATSETFDQTLTIRAPEYTITDTNTGFTDACAGGSVRVLDSGDSDEGITTIINAPALFDLFGVQAAELVVSTNGFLTFDQLLSDPFAFHDDLPNPDEPSFLIAPFWTDLDNVVICTKTDGTKLIVQWTGVTFEFEEPVQFQAILDGANDSIEFVWGPNHVPLGAPSATRNGATIGIEDSLGERSRVIGFDTDAIAPNSSQKLTP